MKDVYVLCGLISALVFCTNCFIGSCVIAEGHAKKGRLIYIIGIFLSLVVIFGPIIYFSYF